MAQFVAILGPLTDCKPIIRRAVFITRTRQVPSKVVSSVVSGINLIVNAGRPNIEIRDLRDWGINEAPALPHQSLDWYQSQALLSLDHGFGRQIDTSKVLYAAMAEPWQETEPHFEAMIVDHDLNLQQSLPNGRLDYINFVFGSTLPNFGFIISPVRILNELNIKRHKVSRDFLLGLIRRLAAHEFGHVMGLLARTHNTEHSLGLHCAGEKGPCLMRQGLSLEVWIRQHLEETQTKQELCPDCRDELKEKAFKG